MNLRSRRCSTTRPAESGLTLLEALIAIGMFAVMLGAVVLVEQMVNRSDRQADRQSTVHRQAVLGLEKIRAELQGGLLLPQVAAGEETDRLVFYAPDRADSGLVQLGPTGDARFQPELVSLEGDGQGHLLRVQGSDSRILASLGDQGRATFRLAESLDLVEVVVHAEQTAPAGPPRVCELRLSLPLPNQF